MNVEKFNDYQAWAGTTAVYPEEAKVLYPLLGLVGETSEVVEKILNKINLGLEEKINGAGVSLDHKVVKALSLLEQVAVIGKELEVLKKDIRKNGTDGAVVSYYGSTEDIQEVSKEIGDQMWYQGALASDLNLLLGDVAQQNHDKLEDRKTRNVLTGSGDNR